MDGGIIEHSKIISPVVAGCIELVDGRLFNPMDPDPDLMSLEVISTALANCTRFGGQIRDFYSIGQHSVLVAVLTDQDMAAQRCALLHDADECFGLPDLPTPVKPCFPEYVAAQKRIGAAVDGRYGVTEADHRRTKPADREALLVEKHRLKDPSNAAYWQNWSTGVTLPDWIRIEPLQPEASQELVDAAMRRVFIEALPINREWVSEQSGFILC
ncbi:HD domain-containing protein [Epibacterium sp. DP7N7-1]|nr:HD domain-containing protein [Epibacterium sp. DP7N7-1]